MSAFSAATLRSLRARLLSLCAPLAIAPFALVPATHLSAQVVISQIFGGNSASGPYNQDYVELFNQGSQAVSLNTYGLQYASSSGVNYSVVKLSGSIAPGGYFLIGLASSTGGNSLPTPDVTGGTNLSGTTGKVYLTSDQNALTLTSGCPTSTSIVDFVGYGSGATCYRGSAPAPTITSSQAESRTSPCAPNSSNSTDFAAITPAPHTSSSPIVSCSAATALSGSATVSPTSVYQGSTALLAVRAIPGSNPASTGITAIADLSAEGGSTTQALYDDGTHGDATAGDNTFSFQFTVTNSSATGAQSIPVRLTDAQARSANTFASLTVQAPAPTVSIRDIQSSKPSRYVKQTVTTTGIVISVKSNGFYLEAQDADQNPTTPEGILVYTGSSLPSTVAVGEVLQVTGTVNSYPTAGPVFGTEIDSPTNYAILQNSVSLPTPITITSSQDSPTGGIYQFSRYEGMRVTIPSFTTTSGTDASLTENTETNTSNGQFYGTVTGVARPFREPGISVLEPTLPSNTCPLYQPSANCIPLWDSNPELLLVDSKITGGTPLDLTSLTTLSNLTGVIDFSSGNTELILDRASRPTVSGGLTAPTLPVEATGEFTVSTFNLERFYNDQADADNPGSSAVTLTTAAFQRRLSKASLAIRNVLNAPDILGVEEMENLATLTSLAQKISSDAQAAGQADPAYQPFTFLANDGTAINTGLLVKRGISVSKVEQFGLNTTFTNANGQQAILNDRTPLVAHLVVQRAGFPDYPVTAIVVHQRSLINVDDTTSTGATVRLKREAQGEYLANLIQGYQAAGEHVVTVGDFNAFEFNDGYVDTIGVTKGNPVPASQVLQQPTAGLVSPVLTDLALTLPASLRQSYVEDGSAQILDHVLVTQDLAALETRFVYAHINADFPLVDLNDATTPLRVSDHDPAVAYFAIPNPNGNSQLSATATLSEVSGGYQQVLTLTNNGSAPASNVSLATDVLGAATYTALPASFGTIPAGGSTTLTFLFPASAGTPGSRVVERFSGSSATANFNGSLRVTLP